MHTSSCAVCGAEFLHKRARAQYCSKDCTSKASYERRRDAGTFIGRRVVKRTCVVCGLIWSTQYAKSRYCSKACQDAVRYPLEHRRRRGPMNDRLKAARRKQRAAARGARGKGRWTSGQCRTCHAWFASQYADITCSQPCSDQHQKNRSRDKEHNYRARKIKAFVEKVYRKKIFEADGYRCHICRRLTDRTKKAPHPRAPTIDHVIPLAAGGKHEPTNCRTACFLCNCTKRECGGGEQLALLAV